MNNDIDKATAVTLVPDADYDSSGIPEKIDYMGNEYTIEIIKKEVPEELIMTKRLKLVYAGYESLMYFLIRHVLAYIGVASIVFYDDWIRLVLSYLLIASLWFSEYYVYKRKCRKYQKKESKLFPHIKVSHDGSVITTMTPKAYVGKLDISVLDSPLPVLPYKTKCIGYVYTFSADRFRAALSNAIKSREAREAKKS